VVGGCVVVVEVDEVVDVGETIGRVVVVAGCDVVVVEVVVEDVVVDDVDVTVVGASVGGGAVVVADVGNV
jgi:hypothetical protein